MRISIIDSIIVGGKMRLDNLQRENGWPDLITVGSTEEKRRRTKER